MSAGLTLQHFLIVGAVLFIIGMIGFLTRRNMIILFLCAEMMLQGVAINLCAFARYRGHLQGQSFVLFILTVAACEAGVALAMILMLYKSRRTLDISVWQDLREPDQDPVVDEDPLPPTPREDALPQLVPAGKEPAHRPESSHV
jgi:NADH-quinone oxidoreductase subunit K